MNLQERLALTAKIRRTSAPPVLSTPINDDIHTVVLASSAGDNTIVVSPGGAGFVVVEILLWQGTGAQDWVLRNGPNTLLQMAAVPVGSGLVLGYAAEGKHHFRVDAGQPLVLNLSIGSLVTGFVKTRFQ